MCITLTNFDTNFLEKCFNKISDFLNFRKIPRMWLFCRKFVSMVKKLLPILLYCIGQASTGQQLPDLHSPLGIPLTLSGNFGELRNNHFHSGLDFKTNGKTGYKVYCADDGYVCRVVVSPWGFGRAVYVAHPRTGLTTVYGHLDSFTAEIARRVRAEQYRLESFSVDMTFSPDEIPVSRGEVIAISGNSGSSGGPHLHMDVRDSATEEALDPMPYFRSRIADTVAPEVRGLALYPTAGGSVNGSTACAAYLTAKELKTAGAVFTAWGNVIPGIKAYDRMTGTHNIYGVKYLTLNVDGREVYSRTTDRIDFATTRAVNTLIDYPDKVNHSSWIMTTRIPPANPLAGMLRADGDGVLTIDREKEYRCEWVLTDDHGNITRMPFTIRGRKTDATKRATTPRGTLFRHDADNKFCAGGVQVRFPRATFYSDFHFEASTRRSPSFCSEIHTLGTPTVPLAGKFDLTIKLTDDTLTDKRQYCIVKIDGKKRSALATTYTVGGSVKASPNSLGSYAVTTDTLAPAIVPVRKTQWSKSGKITYKLSDNLSGLQTYRGEIDGKFVIFELDGKTGCATYPLSDGMVKRGGSHRVTLTATDACGNTATVTDTFNW